MSPNVRKSDNTTHTPRPRCWRNSDPIAVSKVVSPPLSICSRNANSRRKFNRPRHGGRNLAGSVVYTLTRSMLRNPSTPNAAASCRARVSLFANRIEAEASTNSTTWRSSSRWNCFK